MGTQTAGVAGRLNALFQGIPPRSSFVDRFQHFSMYGAEERSEL